MMAIPYLMPLLLSFFPLLCCNVFCAQLVQVNNFGNNPSGIQMFEYVPNNVKPNPPLLVANHWCTGSAQAMYSGSKFSKLADQYGFIVIYSSVTRPSKCWDVYSANGLRRNGGSDSQGIISMVNCEINRRNVDKSKVFVTGSSSGAMMTNVLLAEYPDVFAAGSAIAGVPYSCFATTGNNTWNSTCSSGNVNQSPSQWGNLVRAAFPGYNGKRPRVQLIHGSNDVTLNFKNLQEELDQWSNVLGLSQTPAQTDQPNVDISGVTAIRRRYGGTGNQPPLETITLQGATHSLSLGGILSDLALRFFGLIP